MYVWTFIHIHIQWQKKITPPLYTTWRKLFSCDLSTLFAQWHGKKVFNIFIYISEILSERVNFQRAEKNQRKDKRRTNEKSVTQLIWIQWSQTRKVNSCTVRHVTYVHSKYLLQSSLFGYIVSRNSRFAFQFFIVFFLLLKRSERKQSPT